MNDSYKETTRGRITVRWHYDYDCEPPWEHECGHGPVRTVRCRRDKRPGERPLCSDRGTVWLYDWQAACKAARRDGWNAEPYDAPNRIERAVQADYDYLREYLRGDWHWCGRVTLIDGVEYDSLWGIDSPSMDQFEEETFAEATAYLASEESETLDAACRDIVTV